jgi:hypothetical protein
MLRKFNFSDELLLQYGSTTVGYLTNDLPLFKAFDKALNEAKAKALTALVELALREGGDDHKVTELGEKTENMLQQMHNSSALFSQLRYWVVKAFPTQKAVQRQFGIGRLSKATKTQTAMIEFMYEVAETTAQYQQQLIAVGTDKQLLQQVAQQPKLLQDANQAQEQNKGTRTVDTEERIIRLNQLFDHLRDFNNAAEYVFISQPAKRDNYRAPSTNQPVAEELLSE